MKVSLILHTSKRIIRLKLKKVKAHVSHQTCVLLLYMQNTVEDFSLRWLVMIVSVNEE